MNPQDKTFVPLHVHSMYSRLIGGDGFCFPRELAQRAKDIGCPAIALTDHGTLAGTTEFYRDCQKIGIKPILGMEAYITPMGHSLDERVVYDVKDMRGKPGYIRNNYHLNLWAKDDEGWSSLMELSKQSYAKGYYYKPRIDHELLMEHHKGLICGSACVLGEIASMGWCGDYEKARQTAQWYQELFGEDYYLEVMYHGLDMERAALAPVRDIARELGIKIIATNDSHYSVKSEYKLHKALMLDKMHKSFADSDVSGSFFGDEDEGVQSGVEEEGGDSNPIFETSSELYIKDWDEMVAALALEGATEDDVATELTNTLEIADKCNFDLPLIDMSDMSAYYTPVYPVEKDLQYDAFKESGFEIKQSTVDAIIDEMHKDGREGDKLEDFLNDHEMLSLRFLMWMCDKGLRENVLPKLKARGEALPMEFWCDNPPEGFSIRHTHNSPDELWIREQMRNGLSVDDMIKVYQERIDYEVSVVVRKGFIDYFSVVQNYANFTKLNGSVMGPGRGCVTPDTGIVLEDGSVRPIEEIKVGDITIDEKGQPAEVLKRFEYKVSETLCDLTVYSAGHIKLTPDHKVLVAPALRTNNYDENAYREKAIQYHDTYPQQDPQWLPAKDVHKGDWLFFPKPDRKVIDGPSSYDLADYIPKGIRNKCDISEEYIDRKVNATQYNSDNSLSARNIHRISGVSRNAIRDFFTDSTKTQDSTIQRLNQALKPYGLTAETWRDSYQSWGYIDTIKRIVPINTDFMQFIGYFITDGNVHKSVIHLYFNEHDQNYINKYSQITERLFGKPLTLYKPFQEKAVIAGKITSPIIAEFIRSLIPWKTAAKQIPDCFMHLNDTLTKALLIGMIDGDGSLSHKEGRVSFTSICRESVYKVRYLFASLGTLGAVSKRLHLDHSNWSPSWTVRFPTSPLMQELFDLPDKKSNTGHMCVLTDNSMFAMRVKSNNQFTYSGSVYDLKVDTQNEPSYLTEGGIIHNSGGGSLLLYLLSITSIDPIPNKLLFFRFLNPDRKGYPDVDLDWSADFRDNRLKPYLREFYGDDYCAQVATYMYYWGKAAIKSAARILFPMPDSVQIGTTLSDALDDKPKLDLNKELDGSNPQFEQLVNSRQEYKQTIELARMIQGRLSGESIHASAYIVSPRKLTDFVPLSVTKDERARAQKEGTEIKEYLIQLDGNACAEYGLVKLDLLCVVDLEMMEMTCKAIERVYGCKINLERIPLDDAAVWTMLQEHLVAGIFQLDGSEGMAKVMDQVRPENIENINAIVALYRPGPMDYIPNYVEGKNHPEKVRYLDERIKPILQDTYGVVCVADGTLVSTESGKKAIEEISVGDRVYAEDGCLHNVSAFYDNGIKETLRIRGTYGEELVCTPDHKILTSDGWVEAGNLKPGMLMKCGNPYKMAGELRTPEPFNWEEWFIGLFLADGYSAKSTPTIACASKEYAEELARQSREHFPNMQGIHTYHSTNGTGGTSWYVLFAQRAGRNGSFSANYQENELNQLLRKYNLWHCTRDKKRLPSDYSYSMLIGMFEGDGCGINKRLNLKYERLARDFYEAALSYGLNVSLYKRDESSWTVSISGNIASIFPFNIRRYDQRVEKRHSALAKDIYIPRKSLVGYPSLIKKSQIFRHGQLENIPAISVSSAKANGLTDADYESMHQEWSKVLSVIPAGKHHVYDVTVDDVHQFIAGNIIISNCFQEEAMQITQVIGKFSGGEADTYRKNAAKKHPEELAKMGDTFISRAVENDTDPKVAEELWTQLVKFGSYAFNRCLTGDTLLHLESMEVSSRPDMTIAEAYRLAKSAESGFELLVSCRDADGHRRPHRVKDVYEQGVRDVHLVSLENGKGIKATSNHRFQVADGSYKVVADLVAGEDSLWCCDFDGAGDGSAPYLSCVVSIEPAGREMTYDVEIESEEHNFFANGICSHNSHSAAYALIAYRGAFLKAHFPECFFASLCTLKPKAKKTNKVPEYLDEARQMGVVVKPPHVNYSEAGFDVPERGVIAFGLAGIGGVGAAADYIVRERHERGPFRDFSDFMTRVPREVGKGALLPLMKYGALDGLGWSRKAMVESIDQIIDFRKRWFASREQRRNLAVDLFSLGAPERDERQEAESILLTPPFDTEYNKRQMLEMEKRNFGTYLSGSPEDYRRLSRYATEQRMGRQYKASLEEARQRAKASGHADNPPRPVHVKDLAEYDDYASDNGKPVTFICVVSDPVSKNKPNPRVFQSGKGCSVNIQDWGTLEESRVGFSPRVYKSRLTIFKRLMDRIALPQPGDLLHVTGKVNIDKTGEWPNSVIVDELEVIPDDRALLSSMSREELTALRERLDRVSASMGDPSSDMYMVPTFEFGSVDQKDAFVASATATERFKGSGHVLVTVAGDGSTPETLDLRPTVQVVQHAQRFGATVKKFRLPKAQSAIERMRLMKDKE